MEKCTECGSPFALKHPLHRYCGAKCRRNAYIKRRRRKIHRDQIDHWQTVVCPRCGTLIPPTLTHRKDTIYCSVACKQAIYRARKKRQEMARSCLLD